MLWMSPSVHRLGRLSVQGRDANRKLQRAIKAGKARDRMPAVIEHMQGMMEAWLESEGRTFVYDGNNYMVRLLP